MTVAARGSVGRRLPLALHLLPWLAGIAVFFLAPSYLGLATQILIMILFALSLDLALGHGGIITLGHAALFGIGAYAAALFAVHVSPDPLAGLLFGTLVAALFGFLSGALILHTHGLTLLVATLAIGALVAEAANGARWLTGGDDGIQLSIGPLLGAYRFDLWSRTSYLYSLAVLFLWFVAFVVIVRSPFGRSVDGIRQNPARMRAIGTPVWWRLVAVYTLAAAMAGTAGALSAQTTRVVGLNSLGIILSGTVLLVLVLGGTRRLYGAFVGAIAYVLIHDFASQIDPFYWMFVIGGVLMLVVLFIEGGLMGSVAALRRLRRAAPAGDRAQEAAP